MSSNPSSTSCCTHPDDETTFTCPICLVEKPAAYTTTTCDLDDSNDCKRDADGASCPIFQLSSCNHQFCTTCLRAYVRSKLFDGEVDIPCCHFKVSSTEEDDFRLCNVLLEEMDIDQLLHLSVGDDDESNTRAELFCTADDPCYDIFTSKSSTCKNNKSEDIADQLWIKYQKIKFDLHHGRDAVRRCPNCDEAHLFDEEAMKQYQSKFLSQDAAPAVAAATATDRSNVSTGNLLSVFRRTPRRGNAKDTSSRDAQRDENIEIVVAADKEQKENPKVDSDIEPSDGVIPTLTTSSINNDEATPSYDEAMSSSITDERGSKPPLESNLAKIPQDETTPALIKSKTPIVTCHKCSKEFCYFHSNAHSGTDSTSRISCTEYHKKSLELDRANVDFASRVLRAKPCPTCGISVSKEGGCNQIKCGSCGTHFCWLCGAIVDDGAFPEHFRWWNLRGCANLQLDENTDPLRCTIWGARLMSGFQIIVLGIPSVVLTLVSMLLCPCFVPSCGNTNRERVVNCISFWGSFLSSLLMLPFTCLGMILLLALSCFVAALSSLSKIFTPANARSHAENAAASRNSNTSDPDEFIRELGTILERLEEGRTALSDSSIQHST